MEGHGGEVRSSVWDSTEVFFEVVGVGLITCVELGSVKRIHTLFVRNAQVVHELQVGEAVEGVRQEVREVKGEEKGEIKVEGEPHTS